MNAPADLIDAVRDHVGAVPQAIDVRRGADPVGMIRCTIDGAPCVIKWTRETPSDPWPDRCTAEAQDFHLLAGASALRVPQVIAHAPLTHDRPALVITEWIASGGGDRRTEERLGHGLAALHCSRSTMYGLHYHNYCGLTPQPNTQTDSWITFYGQQRLGWQRDLALRNGVLPPARRDRLERLIASLDRWIDERAIVPSLLHGDLWGGNWLADQTGAPVLIDPAAYVGDREAELAMCRLFGGFGHGFFAAYDEAWPPAPGRNDRIGLYQLYHLLNHLNIFGPGYGARVDQVLQRYVG